MKNLNNSTERNRTIVVMVLDTLPESVSMDQVHNVVKLTVSIINQLEQDQSNIDFNIVISLLENQQIYQQAKKTKNKLGVIGKLKQLVGIGKRI